MKVSEKMTKDPVTVKASATAKEVAEKMKKENIGTVLVEENGRLKGIVTDRQIATKVVAAGKDPSKTQVSEFMTENPVTGRPDMEMEDVTKIIGEMGYRRVPIVEGERLVGIISAADIVEHARTCQTCMGNIFNEVEKAQR